MTDYNKTNDDTAIRYGSNRRSISELSDPENKGRAISSNIKPESQDVHLNSYKRMTMINEYDKDPVQTPTSQKTQVLVGRDVSKKTLRSSLDALFSNGDVPQVPLEGEEYQSYRLLLNKEE